MDIFLEAWGGVFYLLNKIFFSRVERTTGKTKRLWDIWSWAVYLVGLPAVVAMLAREHDWIFAALEVGGGPIMVLGLLNAIRNKGKKENDAPKKEPSWVRRFLYAAIVIGFLYSVYEFGGLKAFTQWLEVVAVAGFLVGTYRLAKKHADGYLWYVLMSVATALLMWIQDKPWFTLQQIASLAFVIDAYLVWKRKQSAQ